jgi:hypothetical protein
MIAYVLLIVAVVAFFVLLSRFLQWFAGPAPQLLPDLASRLRRYGILGSSTRWDAPVPPDDETRKVNILHHTTELRRLAGEIQKARSSDQPGKMLKITASVQAYDDVLLSCCRTAGVTMPAERPPLTATERLDAEAALLSRGIKW